ncbi:MAG: hypothetical protein AABZ02_11695 [Bacteroidota bacterium]
MSGIIPPFLLATLFGCGRAPIDRTPITLDQLAVGISGAGLGDLRSDGATAGDWVGGGKKSGTEPNVYDVVLPVVEYWSEKPRYGERVEN